MKVPGGGPKDEKKTESPTGGGGNGRFPRRGQSSPNRGEKPCPTKKRWPPRKKKKKPKGSPKGKGTNPASRVLRGAPRPLGGKKRVLTKGGPRNRERGSKAFGVLGVLGGGFCRKLTSETAKIILTKKKSGVPGEGGREGKPPGGPRRGKKGAITWGLGPAPAVLVKTFCGPEQGGKRNNWEEKPGPKWE